MAEASEPPLASVMATAARPPAAMRGRKRLFCSGVPNCTTGPMAWKVVAQVMAVDGQARADRLDQLQVAPVRQRSPAVLLGDEHAVHAEAVEELDVLPGELLGLVVLLGPGGDLLDRDLADVFDELRLGLVERGELVESVEQGGHRRRPCAPSMVMVSPVRNRQSAVRTATTSRAISSAVPIRPTGMRRSSPGPVLGVGEVLLVEAGLDVAGGEVDDGDPGGCPFDGQRAGDAGQCGLGGGVGEAARHAEVGVERADEGDEPAGPREMRPGELGDPHRRHEVRLQHGPQAVHRQVGAGTELLVPGAVDHAGQPAAGGGELVDRRRQRRMVVDVEPNGRQLPLAGRHRAAAAGAGHDVARPGPLDGDGGADAAAGSGDEHSPPRRSRSAPVSHGHPSSVGSAAP